MKTKRKPPRWSLADQLREIIQSRQLTAYCLGQAADVDPSVIQRFLSHRRDIQLETAGRIAAALNVRLVEVAVTKARGKAPRPELPTLDDRRGDDPAPVPVDSPPVTA